MYGVRRVRAGAARYGEREGDAVTVVGVIDVEGVLVVDMEEDAARL